uniref:Ubiquitin-like protease family profile domain-containing protein n=1 Tax=Glossina palpalis gambiensis TaxID=67801 RepID=A0A1B0BBM2_9MUSC
MSSKMSNNNNVMLEFSTGRFSIALMDYDYGLLRPGQWLNDEVMEVFGKWLQDSLPPKLRERVYMFSPFLFTQLNEDQPHWSSILTPSGE